jgi:putative endonuclease
MTNRPNGTLYVGATDGRARRAREHRGGLVEGSAKQYGLGGSRLPNNRDDLYDRLEQVVDGRHKAGRHKAGHERSEVHPTSLRQCPPY